MVDIEAREKFEVGWERCLVSKVQKSVSISDITHVAMDSEEGRWEEERGGRAERE